MRDNENKMTIEGKIYQFNLEEKVSGETSKYPGTPYITGTIDVAIDETLSNIISVHYTYVAPTFPSKKVNPNYSILNKIIENKQTVLEVGYDAATAVRLTPSYQTNDFYPQNQDEPVSAPRNEGGFITILSPDKMTPVNDIKRHKFIFDIVISRVSEQVPEEGDSYAKIEGIVFGYKNKAVYPITLIARNEGAINYFLGLGAAKDNPVYTRVWGRLNNVITTTEKTIESAFGEPTVEQVIHRTREYEITGANPVPYEFDTETTITGAELQKVLQDRQVYLAAEKQRTEEWRASQSENNASPAAQAAQTTSGVKQGDWHW